MLSARLFTLTITFIEHVARNACNVNFGQEYDVKAFLGSYIKLPGSNSLMAITGRLLNNDISFRAVGKGLFFEEGRGWGD